MRRFGILLGLLLAALLLSGCAGTGGGARGMVVADHPLAAQAGAEMLRKGGNAVDAAVATSFALSVVRPESCGIGGGGFMLIQLRNDPRHGTRSLAIDYRERAPGSAKPDMFESLSDGASRTSGHAVAVPGTVAGLLHALDRYGSLDRATVLAPAIGLADQGFWSDRTLEKALPTLRSTLDTARPGAGESDTALRRLYLQPPLTSGRRFIRNPGQAEALTLIAKQGAEAFYGGPIGQALVRAVNETGGEMTARDLHSYRITETRPLSGTFKGRTILTMPLPSSGGITLLQILRLIELRPDLLVRITPTSGPYLQALVESFKFAFADRAEYLGDPQFGPDPTRTILADARLRARAAAINEARTFPPEYYTKVAPLPEDHGTSHICVVDRWGSAVACTETINLTFGARLAVPEYGFCLNNEMDDFLTRRKQPNAFGLLQSDRNLPAPGKRPLSSMTPTIVLDARGAVEMVVGASGGPRIITATAQAMLNVMLLGMTPQSAVDTARIHHQWMPDKAEIEEKQDFELPGGVRDFARWRGEVSRALSARGHVVVNSNEGASVQMIERTGSGWQGAADPRKGGGAVRE